MNKKLPSKGIFTIQLKLVLFFAVFFLILIIVGLVSFVQINRSIVQSQKLINANAVVFGEIDLLFETSNTAQSIFDRILLFESTSLGEIHALQLAFNKSVLEFDVLTNVLVYGESSDEFLRVNLGLDAYIWELLRKNQALHPHDHTAADHAFRGSGEVDTALYDRIVENYDVFVFNVNESIAAQRKYVRKLEEIELRAPDHQDTHGDEGILTEDIVAVHFAQDEADQFLRTAQIFGQRANAARGAIAQDLAEASSVIRENLLDQIITETTHQQSLYVQGLAYLLASILILALVASFIVHFLFIKPLKELTETAQKVIDGDHTLTIPLQGSSDEIGVLARALNEMLEQLLGYTQSLERDVASRTNALNEKNAELEESLVSLNETAKLLMRRDIELTQANNRLKEADEVKSEFVSVAAHQLRTPLTVIRWTYESLAQAEEVSAENKEIIHNAIKATNNLIVLVNDLLNIARIDEGRFDLDLKEHNLYELLRGIVSEYTVEAKHKGVDFVMHITRKIPDFYFDWEKIDIMLRNILSNAMKYTEAGGKVEWSMHIEGDILHIVVEDSGIGIPKKQLPRIFTKFFRADNALLHQTNGSGLGLYVTKSIAKKHGGTIALESEEDKGTTFYLTLPLRREPLKKSLPMREK